MFFHVTESTSIYKVDLKLYATGSYDNDNDVIAIFPYETPLRNELYFKVELQSLDDRLSTFLDECFATPGQHDDTRAKHLFLRNG